MVSDTVYYLLYYIIGYRKNIVYENLKRSFPSRDDKEINQLSREFYRYFCDLLLETFKTLTISKAAMLAHCRFDEKSLALLHKLQTEDKSVLLVLGHKGNWEWAGNSFSLCAPHQLFVIYHPLANPYFDKLMYRMRSRFGTKLIPMQESYKIMAKNKSLLSATAFIADQTPQPVHAHWMSFLNQDTPVFMGTEKIAHKMNRLVLFVSVQKTKRGYYSIVIKEEDSMHPEQYAAGQLTEAHTRKLEADILREPATWLWTHRRWKHKRTVNN
jgi:KDO2-lipid IV(A) lauroyltransferase